MYHILHVGNFPSRKILNNLEQFNLILTVYTKRVRLAEWKSTGEITQRYELDRRQRIEPDTTY